MILLGFGRARCINAKWLLGDTAAPCPKALVYGVRMRILKGLKFKSLFCELEIINQGPFTVGGSCLGVNEYLTPNNVNREGE